MEYQLSWPDKLQDLKDEEKKEQFKGQVGTLIKYCLKDGGSTFNLLNPVIRDVDGNTVYMSNIVKYNITPLFVSSNLPNGTKTSIGVFIE